METKKFLDGEGLKTLWDEITALQSDYNETDETSPNYIKNKPFTIDVIPEEVIEEFTFTTSDKIDESTGLPTMQYVQMFDDLTIGQKMNLQFTYPELAAATGQPQYDDNENIITKTVRYENIEVGNFADAMGSQFLDSPAIMMGPGALIATLPESIQRVAIPNDDIVFVYSNATLANGTKTPLLITALMDWSTAGYSTYIATCHTSTFTTEKIDLIANRENHIALQSDWDEQNKENSAYIQNKPFGDEIILTPKNEFYRDSFIEWYGDDKSGFGNPGYSLQVETGKQYILQAFGNDGESGRTVLTCVDHTFEGINLPEGAYLLGDFNNQGQLNSLTFLVDKAKFDSTQENMVYDENSCLIVFTDELYKIIIHDTPLEGTYERTIINKIDKKYLPKADQSYNWTSENAQSGIAVNEAISKIQNRLPGSVITSLIAPTTLGDQHVKVQFDSTNSNTSPQSTTWDVYTTGIGLNSDLNTSAKDTIVNAINENKSNLDNFITEHNTKTTVAISDQDKIWINGKDILLDKVQISYNKIPYNYTIRLNNVGVSYGIYGTNSNTFFDLSTGTIFSFDNNGKLVSTIISNRDVLKSNMSQVEKICSIGRYYYEYSYQKWNNFNGSTVSSSYTNDNYFYIIALLTDGTYGTFKINKNGTCTALQISTNITGGDYTPIGSYCKGKSSSSETSSGKYGTYTIITHGLLSGFEPTSLEKPGLLKASVVDKTFGSENYSNAQIIATTGYNNTNAYTFFRALKEDGTEIIEVYTNGLTDSKTYNGIDGNEHSTYCNLIENNQHIVCLTSAQEILCRNIVNGSILWKKPIKTTSDLFTKNLQYVTLINYDDINLYINDKNNLYCLDMTEENPTMVLVESSENPHEITKFSDTLIRYSDTKERDLDIYILREVFLPENELFKNIQPDYNQNDSTKLDYIKNKPITVEYATNYLTKDKSIPVAQQMGNEAFVVEDQFIDLVIGEKYDIDMNITSTIDNSTTTHTFKDVECVDMCGFWKQSLACPGIVIAPELMLSLYPSLSYATLSDGLVFMYTNNFNGAAYDETKCITCVGEIDGTGAANTNITITVNVSQTSVEGEISEPYAKFLQADWLETDETKIGYIKNKPSTGDYYFFNLKNFADIEQATKQYDHAVKNPSSGVYNDYFAINVVLGLGGVKGQTYYNITNIPYETLCINDYPYITDKHRFKNMGLKSPAFKQLLNYDGIVWFDAIEDCLRDILTDNFSSLYTITRQYSDMMIGFVIYGEVRRNSPSTMNPKVQQAIGLWDAVLNDPDTQIVIEYQNSQNVQHIEGQLIMPVAELEEVE